MSTHLVRGSDDSDFMSTPEPSITLERLLNVLRDQGGGRAAELAAALLGRPSGEGDRRLVNALLFEHPELAERDDDTGEWRPLVSARRPPRQSEEPTSPTLAIPLETFSDQSSVREALVRALELDLLGPGSPDEVIDERPMSRYLLGILEPGGSQLGADASEPLAVEAEDDEVPQVATSDKADDEADADEPLPSTDALSQSSIGLTFAVDAACDYIGVTASFGTYAREAGDGRDLWRRTSHVIEVRLDLAHPPDTLPLAAGAELRVVVRPVAAGSRTITLFLVNRNSAADERADDSECIFQPALTIQSPQGSASIVHRPAGRGSTDADNQSNSLLYRLIPEFAAGHGCSVGWRASGGGRAESVWTAVMPLHELPAVDNSVEGVPPIPMASLGTAAVWGAVVEALGSVPSAYEAWIARRATEVASLPDDLAETAAIHLEGCRIAAGRILGGVELLENDAEARLAFQLANDAMRLQRLHTEQALAMRRTGSRPELDTLREPTWRPFQLAFILLNLDGITSDGSPDRKRVDLLWFPTGGGKTEAYLGLAVYAIFLRRLKGAAAGDAHAGAGVAVLMRYTLRLLTVQQFQRAAALACAAESLRRERSSELGDDPISIGLWVGQKTAPNNYEDAKARLQELRDGRRIRDSNPYQISACPWCGEPVPLESYAPIDATHRVLVHCPNPECAFHGAATDKASALPITAIDEEIYATCPSIVIGTVDKFARLPWNQRTMTLFGRVGSHCVRHGFIPIGEDHAAHRQAGELGATVPVPIAPLAPPDLIIQDELHLITGPLGTLTGIYEAAVEFLATRTVGSISVTPKIIASTATIRRADEQVLSLFARPVSRFPPPGLDAGHSFFATEVPHAERPGRLYLGVYAPGRSVQASIVRVYARLLQRAEELWRAAPESAADELLDPFWTIVGYFNSLRELGGAVRLVDDDIPGRLDVLAGRAGTRRREILNPKELTSRIPPETVPEILSELERSVASGGPIDVLLATNMIQVGVDVDRLGLMVVAGQPKTSAEYIQATSRVGRSSPGLVITLFNWARPRDISHYEQFEAYHSALYRHVEGATLTPFAPRARDRALAGVYIAMNRLARDGWSENKAASSFDRNDPIAVAARAHLVARANRLDPGQAAAVEEELTRIADGWQKRADAGGQLSYVAPRHHSAGAVAPLMVAADDPQPPEESYRVLGSLREVETEVDLHLVSRSDPLSPARMIGRLRPSQLVTTFGPGSLVDLPTRSVIIAGLDFWRGGRELYEPRLQALLGVDEFRSPPQRLDHGSVPCIDFPRWQVCGRDGRLLRSARCPDHGNDFLYPARLIQACEFGHLEDFPWRWWIHRGTECRGDLTLSAGGRSSSLGDLEVRCRACGRRRSLSGATSGGLGIRCRGARPWLRTDDGECEGTPRGLLRGASNVYFPLTSSALAIPPWTNPIQERLGRIWSMVSALSDDQLRTVHPLMFSEWSEESFLEAVRARREGTQHVSATVIKSQEFQAIMHGQPNPDRDFQVTELAPPANRVGIRSVRRLDRLREVVALRAFTRIDYPDRDATAAVNEAPIASTRLTWCPAIENRGEGILVEFDDAALSSWSGRPSVRRLAADISRAQDESRRARGLDPLPPITAELVLVHTLSHVLIRQLSLDSGYSSASLRERLYVDGRASAVLIYTASGDSDGSLGGLIAQAAPERLGALVEGGLAAAAVCSSDPLCAERSPRGGHLSGAACHACLLISETSCEMSNRYLDRGVIADLAGAGRRFAAA